MVRILVSAFILGMTIIMFCCKNSNKGQKGDETSLLIDLADSLAKSNTDTAVLLYKAVIDNASLMGTSYNVRALQGIGKIYAFEGKYDSAGAKYVQALAIASSLNDTALMIKSRLLKGNNYGETQCYAQSEEEFNEGLKLAKSYKSLNSQNSFNINLGRLKLYSADYKGAIENFTEGARLAKLDNEPYKEGFALEGIAQIMDITGDFAEAIGYNKSALTIMTKYGYENDVSRVLMNLGLNYKNAGQLDSALYFLESSDSINKKLNNARQQIQVKYNKGRIKLDQKKFAEAEIIMKETYDECVKLKFVDGQAFSLSALSGLYEKTGNPEKALQVIDTSVQLIVDNHISYKLIDVYKQRHSILAGMGKYKEAYISSLQLNKLNDSLISIEKQNEIQVLKIRFETKIKENEISKLTESVTAKAFVNRVQSISIVVLVILLLTASGLSIYIFRLYRWRNAAYSALSRIYRDQMPGFVVDSNNNYQPKEITNDMVEILHKKAQEFKGGRDATADNEIVKNEEDLLEVSISALTNILINQKLYLDPTLTADKLAAAAGLNRQELAKAIKIGFGVSFFQLLNNYRSQHAISLMNDPGNRLVKIEYIGYKSGFSSRATFYSVFTQQTGLPPAIYRESVYSPRN
ncbi:MAG: helix-turn-helix domain-containing protein [Bacteroidales bacterium]